MIHDMIDGHKYTTSALTQRLEKIQVQTAQLTVTFVAVHSINSILSSDVGMFDHWSLIIPMLGAEIMIPCIEKAVGSFLFSQGLQYCRVILLTFFCN